MFAQPPPAPSPPLLPSTMAYDLYLLGPVNNVIKCHPFPLLSIFNGHGNLCSHTRPGENVRTARNCRKNPCGGHKMAGHLFNSRTDLHFTRGHTHENGPHLFEPIITEPLSAAVSVFYSVAEHFNRAHFSYKVVRSASPRTATFRRTH